MIREQDGQAFNVNDYAIVRLTEAGLSRLLTHYTELFAGTVFATEAPNHALSHLQKDGTYKFQLWEVMQIFGCDMFNGSQRMPFVSNRIVIVASL